MRDVWKQLERALRDAAPAAVRTLSGPASAEAVRSAEKTLGIALPREVRESYRLHNGQRTASPELFDGWRLLPLSRVVAEWKVWKRLHDGGEFEGRRSGRGTHHVRDWWHPSWVPLTSNGAGDHHCLDLAPSRRGTPGQVILVRHDDAERPLVAAGFRQWLIDQAEALAAAGRDDAAPAGSPGRIASMDDLVRLVSRTLRDAGVKKFLQTQALKRERDPHFGEHALANEAAGYRIGYGKGDRVENVWIEVAAIDGGQPFVGPLAAGLTADDGHAQVRKRLGPPTRSRNLVPTDPKPQGGWDCYDEPHASIQIFYRKDRRGIARVVVMSPDTAPGRAKAN